MQAARFVAARLPAKPDDKRDALDIHPPKTCNARPFRTPGEHGRGAEPASPLPLTLRFRRSRAATAHVCDLIPLTPGREGSQRAVVVNPQPPRRWPPLPTRATPVVGGCVSGQWPVFHPPPAHPINALRARVSLHGRVLPGKGWASRFPSLLVSGAQALSMPDVQRWATRSPFSLSEIARGSRRSGLPVACCLLKQCGGMDGRAQRAGYHRHGCTGPSTQRQANKARQNVSPLPVCRVDGKNCVKEAKTCRRERRSLAAFAPNVELPRSPRGVKVFVVHPGNGHLFPFFFTTLGRV